MPTRSSGRCTGTPRRRSCTRRTSTSWRCPDGLITTQAELTRKPFFRAVELIFVPRSWRCSDQETGQEATERRRRRIRAGEEGGPRAGPTARPSLCTQDSF